MGEEELPTTSEAAPAGRTPFRTGLTESWDHAKQISGAEVGAYDSVEDEGRSKVVALTTAAHPFGLLVENLPDGAATVAADGHVLYANASLANLLGCAREMLVGRPIAELISGDDDVVGEGLGSDRSIFERDLVAVDGTFVPVLVGASTLEVDGERVACLTFTDLTERRAHEREIARLSRVQVADGLRFTAVVETLQEGVLIQDENGNVLEANRAATEILGIERDDLVTTPPSPLPWHAETRGHDRSARITPGRRALEEGKAQLGVLVNVRRRGQPMWLEINSAPFRLPGDPDDAPVVISSFRDVTERESADRAIRFQAQLLDTAGQAIVAVDGDGAVLYWNEHAEAMYGWTSDEALGRRVADLILPVQTDAQRASMFEAIDAGETHGSDHWVRRRDGSLFPTFATTTPIFDDRGERIATVTVATDITERKATEERARRLSAIVESSSDAIVGMNLDRTITSWNKGATDLFGYTPDEAIGLHVSVLAPSLADDHDLAQLATSEGLSVRDLELPFRTRQGLTVTVSMSLAPILDERGRAVGVSGIGRDITERLRLERLAEAHRVELVAARHAAELAAVAAQEADRANRAKSEFLSRMSHELRTPLNAVLGFAQVLLLDGLDPAQRASVGYIRSAGEHLLDLINDVMDVSRIEAGVMKLSLEAVHLDDVISNSLDLVRPQAASRGIELPTHLEGHDLYVHADRQRLLQVLLNLLSNAVKYNDPGGSIDITCESSGGTVLVAVSDTGIGIDQRDMSKLFTPFERLSAADTDTEGTGVGLALSRALSQQMGGALTVTSIVGHGSTFTLELPACPPPSATAAEAPTATRPDPRTGSKPLTVLAIEDNVANIRLLEEVLKRADNVTLVTAIQGRLGLELATQHLPDVILLDLHLPDIDGEAVLRHLRADPATASIPVVICSADATVGHQDRMKTQGADAYLTKPFDLHELYHVLEQVRAGTSLRAPRDGST